MSRMFTTAARRRPYRACRRQERGDAVGGQRRQRLDPRYHLGIKSLLPGVAQTLPSSLKLTAVGDQSPYVTAAVADVLREASIAAALTR